MTTSADELFKLANCIRALSIDGVEAANSGHPGMGMADAAAVLFANHLKFDATDPNWPDRDRFVLSNGHGSMLLYSVLHLTGYPGVRREKIPHMARRLGRRMSAPRLRQRQRRKFCGLPRTISGGLGGNLMARWGNGP